MASGGDTLDMTPFFGTEEEKREFCSSLLRLLKKRGFVKLQNHGIPAEDIRQLFDMVRTSPQEIRKTLPKTNCVQTRKFFNLPLDTKMIAKHPPQANPNRGYSFVGQENVANISGHGANPGKTRDIKVSGLLLL